MVMSFLMQYTLWSDILIITLFILGSIFTYNKESLIAFCCFFWIYVAQPGICFISSPFCSIGQWEKWPPWYLILMSPLPLYKEWREVFWVVVQTANTGAGGYQDNPAPSPHSHRPVIRPSLQQTSLMAVLQKVVMSVVLMMPEISWPSNSWIFWPFLHTTTIHLSSFFCFIPLIFKNSCFPN